MRATIPYARWKRVRYQLKLTRIPDTKSQSGKQLRNYIVYLDPSKHYPRIHFVVKESKQFTPYVTVHYHVDSDQHQSDLWSPKLDKIANLLLNS